MTEHTAKRARKSLKKQETLSTVELMKKFNLSYKEARRCERVCFGRLFAKERLEITK